MGITLGNVELKIVGGLPVIITKRRMSDDIAAELHEWLTAVRSTGSAMLGSEDERTSSGILGTPTLKDESWKARGPGVAGLDWESDPKPETDKRYGATVRVGGEFSDFTRDGFVIEIDNVVARALVHATGHIMEAHKDALPLIMLASVMKGEPGNALREFNGLAKIASELVKQGVENVEVGGVPVIRDGKVADEFTS